MGLEENSAVPLVKSFVSDLVEAVKVAKYEMERAQQRQKKYYDQGRKELTFKVGAQVSIGIVEYKEHALEGTVNS